MFERKKQAISEWCSGAREAFKSPRNFEKWIRVEEDNESPSWVWVNEDLKPTPPEKRVFGWFTYCTFYFGLSGGNWTLGSSLLGIGLNWWQSIIIIFVSQLISSIAMMFNSRAAGAYHIGYPIVARSCFGIYGSFYVVGARAFLAIIWYAVQIYTGSTYVYNMLTAIFGHYFTDIPNHVPAHIGFTTAQFLSFILFWLISLPFVFMRPYQLRKFFWFKGFVMLPACLGLFIFCMANTNGKLGGIDNLKSAKVSSLPWAVIHGINVGMGNTATLITNQPDIARWSRRRGSSMISQLIVNPIAVTFSAVLGILATSAMNNKWDLQLWNQWDLMTEIMSRYDRPAVKFAVFLSAFLWSIGILGTNIAANLIPFGSDSTLLFPKYITMPRGQIIVHFLSWAVCPWYIMHSAGTFTTFLSGYGLFMASVAAVMIADCNLLINQLMSKDKSFVYYFNRGFSWQAYFAYIFGIALPFTGFVGTLGPSVSSAALKMGYLGWCLSFVTTFIVYYVTCLIFPTKPQQYVRERGLYYEQIADENETVIESQSIEAVQVDLKTKS